MAVIESSSLLSRMKAAKRLPSSPGAAIRVLELCRREDVECQEVADAIMSDAVLSARLLKFANSPVSGIGREVLSVREAILLLGMRIVKLTALGFSLRTSDHRLSCEGFDINQFWAESFAAGVVAKHLAEHVFRIDHGEAFAPALLARIGRLALAQGMPREYSRALTLAHSGTDLLEAEREEVGTNHVDFGVELLEDWGLPETLVAAVRGQNTPDTGGPLVLSVYAATRLAPVFVRGKDLDQERSSIARHVVHNVLKLDETQWKRISEGILGEYLQIAELFEMKLDDDAAVSDLYAEAQEEATHVGLVAQLEQTAAVKANEDLLHRASTDPLTGVANRAKFNEKLTEMVNGLRRGHSPFALLMLDIDHFKKINDTYGHPVGDLVLKRVARAVQNCLRDTDLLVRYGGEEFAILAPDADPRGACIVAARVRKCIEDLRIENNGERLRVTISVGVAITIDHPTPPSENKIIAEADQQLYLSKKSGRNTWSYRGRSASQLA